MSQAQKRRNWYHFQFGMPVFSTDGEEGTLQQFVIDAQRYELQALGIRPSGLFGRTIHVPLSCIKHTDEKQVTLSCNHRELKEPKEGIQGVVIERRSAITRKETAVKGHLDIIAVEPENGRLIYLVVSHIQADRLRLDANYIERIDPGRIRLQGVDEQWSQGYRYYDDEDIRQRAEQALYQQTQLHIDWSGMGIGVEDGVVLLTGNITSSLRTDMITDQVSGVDGVVGVENYLIGDDLLGSDLAYDLSHDPATHDLSLGIYPKLGNVRVSGTVRTEEQKQSILERVRNFPGVTGLVDDLSIGLGTEELKALVPSMKGKAEDVPPYKFTRHKNWQE